jgi:integrase
MGEKNLSGRRINITLQAMRIAVRHAVAREELDRDPFRGIEKAVETPRERGILTPGEVTRLIAAQVTDSQHRLAVLLGCLCGLRTGEIRGLLWEDIGDGVIHVRHNWIDGEGLKSPKCKGGTVRQNSRIVPLPKSINAILDNFRDLNPAPESFVLQSYRKDGEPLSKGLFRYIICKELSAIGILRDEQKRRNLTFHGLRHTFITLGRLAGITDLEIQALAGHKSGAMMDSYSHAAQVLDFASAREKLEKVVGA